MTITVTPEPLNAPPRNVVEVAVPAGSVMSSVAVWRNDLNGRTLLRSQPSAGFDSRTVYDYESPYGIPVTYDWIGQYTDPTAYTTVWNETWASVAAWSGSGWTVAAGKAENINAVSSTISRSVTPGKYRVTLASMAQGGTGITSVAFDSSTFGAGFGLSLQGGGLQVNGATTSISPSSPITIDYGASTVTVSGTGGSFSFPFTYNLATVTLGSYSNSAGWAKVGAVRVYSYPAATNIVQASSPVTLSPADAWLVNVATPSLSFPLSGSSPFKAGIDYIDTVTNPTNTTRHQILGTDRMLPVTTGPRGDDETEMGIYTATNAERIALRALLKPDIPLLVNIPENWGYEFESGFYSIGDVESARQADPRHGASMRRTKLPMVRVSSPVVTVQNSGWSYAALAVELPTYTSVPMSFATYADLASNTRS